MSAAEIAQLIINEKNKVFLILFRFFILLQYVKTILREQKRILVEKKE